MNPKKYDAAIYDMRLGEDIKFSGWHVLKVPFGWIFSTAGNSVFVPDIREQDQVITVGISEDEEANAKKIGDAILASLRNGLQLK